MVDAGVRVALLARSGTARDQLRRALLEAGAQIVAEGDPSELDPEQVAGQAPTVYLVSLEPAIETALERFDELLAAPGVEVMFDDAEVTAKLDGWDLNRWARHLVSKLLGIEGLPPVPDASQGVSEAHDKLAPGLPPTPAELMDHARLEDYTTDTSKLADSVPSSPSLTPRAEANESSDSFTEVPESWESTPASGEDGEFNLDIDLGLDLDLSELDLAPAATSKPSGDDQDSDSAPILGDLDLGENIRFSSFDKGAGDTDLGDLDADVAHLAAQLEAFEKNDQRGAAVDPGFMIAVAAETATATADMPASAGKDSKATDSRPASSPNAAAPSFDFSALSLAPVDGAAALASAAPITPKYAAKAPTLELGLAAIDGEPAPVAVEAPLGLGAVLVLAGLGGPDAVRQLLSSLPEKLPVPVLLYQHLEVGKHERLVEQMAKISRLPVALAREGATPESGKVTLLPAGMTAMADGEKLLFTSGPMSRLISTLPPGDSMIIVLSGADPQLVPMILTVKDAGGLVLAQDPDVCFDAAAADAMRREGAAVYPALGLARQIAARWPT